MTTQPFEESEGFDGFFEPRNRAEALRQKVADRLQRTETSASWIADQVDGSLQAVVDAVMIEGLRMVADDFEEMHLGQWRVWAANRLRLMAQNAEKATPQPA